MTGALMEVCSGTDRKIRLSRWSSLFDFMVVDATNKKCGVFLSKGRRALMKQVLIGGLSVLAMIVGVSAANAQANINPNVYPGNISGPYGAQQKWDWHAGPGPINAAVMAGTTPNLIAATAYQ